MSSGQIIRRVFFRCFFGGQTRFGVDERKTRASRQRPPPRVARGDVPRTPVAQHRPPAPAPARALRAALLVVLVAEMEPRRGPRVFARAGLPARRPRPRALGRHRRDSARAGGRSFAGRPRPRAGAAAPWMRRRRRRERVWVARRVTGAEREAVRERLGDADARARHGGVGARRRALHRLPAEHGAAQRQPFGELGARGAAPRP